MMEALAVLRPGIQKAIDRIGDVATDIEPVYVTAEQVSPAPGPRRKRPMEPRRPVKK